MMLYYWHVIFASEIGFVFSLPARISVGGLFASDDDELELAFRIAVDRINTDETLLTTSRMLALVEKLHSDNSLNSTDLSCKLLHKGIAAIFGPQSQLTSMHVQSICDDLEMPHIEARWDQNRRRDQLSINLYPPPSILSQAFLRLFKIWGWTDYFLVYEEDEAILRMKVFIEEAESQKGRIHLFKLNTDRYRDTFRKIKHFGKFVNAQAMPEYRIVLDVPREKLWHVFKAAQQVGMLTEHQNYLITVLDLHTIDLEEFQYARSNITSLRVVQEESLEFQSLLKEINLRLFHMRNREPIKTLKTESVLIYDSVKRLAYALEKMDQARNVAVFPPISCRLMDKGIDGTSIYNFMKNGQTYGLSGLIEFDPEGFRTKVTFDVMYLTTTGLKNVGVIRLDEEDHDVNTNDTTTLEHSYFRVTTILNDPYFMYKETSEQMKGNDRYEGYTVDFLNALAKELHFTYDINPVRDEEYGRFNETTKTWSGMIGELIAETADLAVADLSITTDRLQGVDFTLPFMQTGIGILYKKPTEKVHSLFSFLSPFAADTWLMMMIAYIFVSLNYFLVGRLSPYEWSNPHPCRETDLVEENVFSLLNSMWLALGSLMKQGSDIAPTAMSTRTIKSIWAFFCLIMISSYTANLAAFLTFEQLVSPINSVEDLAVQQKIKYGCIDSGSTRTFFQRSEMPTYQLMNEFMMRHANEVFMKSNEEGVEKVKKGNYAYLMEITTIEYEVERECNLTQIGVPLDSKGYGIAVRKGNIQLSDWLTSGILKLQESGQLHLTKERWWKQKKGGGKCSEDTKVTTGFVNELGLGNVGGVFVVILIGFLLSSLMGVVEFLWFQRRLQKDDEVSVFKKLVREIKYAITCGSSTKQAPKMKKKIISKT